MYLNCQQIWIRLIFCFYFNFLNLPRGNCQQKTSFVEFQSMGEAREDSFVKFNGTMETSSKVSFCFRFQMFQSRNVNSVLSYAVDSFDDELYLGILYTKQQMAFKCCGGHMEIFVPLKFSLIDWKSICIIVNLKTKFYSFFENGNVINKKIDIDPEDESTNFVIRSGGSLYIGQDQDTLDGSFNKFESFKGIISDVILLQGFVTSTFASDYTKCKSNGENIGELLSFSKTIGKFLISNAVVTEIEIGKMFCEKVKPNDIVFPERRSYHDSEILCHSLGSEIKIPESSEDNLQFYKQVINYEQQCFDGPSDTVWLGIIYNSTGGTWVNRQNLKNLQFSNFQKHHHFENDSNIVCATFHGVQEELPESWGIWKQQDCEVRKCVGCQFKKQIKLTLRGLCSRSEFDKYYHLFTDKGSIYFIGDFYSVIHKVEPPVNGTDEDDFGYWSLSRYDNEHIHGILKMLTPEHYPVGRNKWTIHGDACREHRVDLLLTQCNGDQFTCNDGTCVSFDKMCNYEIDCRDGSDEEECNIVIFPHSYLTHHPPPRPAHGIPSDIYADIHIVSVRSFDLKSFNLVTDVMMELSWFDSRISLRNLMSHETLNVIDGESDKLWLPKLMFYGDDLKSSLIDNIESQLKARKLTEPKKDDIQNFKEDRIYSGSKNPLVLRQKFVLTTKCHLDLSMFPFDNQKCDIIIFLSSIIDSYVQFAIEGSSISFRGETSFLQYSMEKIEMFDYRMDNYSGLHVIMTFQNLKWYYINSVYLPTFTLLLIGYFTFYFNLDDFTNRVMVTLTSLLVQAAFFTQANNEVPTTAYLKMLDIWFLFCIVMLFFIIVLHIVMNTKQKSSNIEVSDRDVFFLKMNTAIYSTPQKKPSNESNKAKRLNNICKVFFPFLSLLFLSLYFTTAFGFMDSIIFG